MLKSSWLKCHLSRKLKDISTPDFSTPWFKNSWLKSPGLKTSWLKSLGLKLGLEKFGVEMSFILFKDIVNTNETQPTLDDKIERIPLDIPAKCSIEVKDVMKKCLDKNPQKRYTFKEIVAKLTDLKQTEDSIDEIEIIVNGNENCPNGEPVRESKNRESKTENVRTFLKNQWKEFFISGIVIFLIFIGISIGVILNRPVQNVNCVVSQWSSCSKTCGPGTQQRSVQTPANYGGLQCPSPLTKSCSMKNCPG